MKILEIDIVKTKSEKVKGRADIHFDGFILKGFKILRDEETKKEYVTPPSYLAGNFWRPLFKTDSPEDWQEIQRQVLKKFNEYLIDETVNETAEI